MQLFYDQIMREIISANQAQLLEVLAGVVDTTRGELQNNSGIKNRLYDNAFTDLKEREMVWMTPQYGRVQCRISVTMKGIRALRDYIDFNERKAQQAPSGKMNPMSCDVYRPKPVGYVRNMGTGHIPSKGLF